MHSETQAHVYVHLYFDTSHSHARSLSEMTREKSASPSEETREFERADLEGERATRVGASAERDLLILQEPNQKYYSFTYLIIQTEFGIISLHVIYLSSKTPRKK